jgi:RNA polymerase sigma factor (sigma-70 family)
MQEIDMSHSYAKVTGFIDRLRHTLPVDASIGDRELLDRYLTGRDETAFAALVKRHGPMVLSLCWRVLRHRQDAEDAFQAVFLVLARKAMTIRRGESLTGWLHRVALHAALRLRASNVRRAERQTTLLADLRDTQIDAGPSLWETQRILEEELDRLPDRYRAALLLCCLQGRTRDEAAHQLGWELGVLRGRLDRGRELLRLRLAQRGIAVSAALLPVLAGGGEAAVVPRLVSSTVRAALAAANHGAVSVSAPAASLAQGIIQTMFVAKVRSFGIGLLMVALLGSGVGMTVYRVHAEDAPAVAQARRVVADDEVARLKREIEVLKLQLQQTRQSLDKANQEIVDLRLAREADAAKRKAASVESLHKWIIDGKLETYNLKQGRVYSEVPVLVEKYRVVEHKNKEVREAAARALVEIGHTKDTELVLGIFSPDGKVIAAAFVDFLSIRDAGTFKEIRRFQGLSGIKSLAFSPDGKLLASGGSDKAIRLWDVTTGKERSKLEQPNAVEAVTFSADGKRIIIRHKTGTMEIDVQSGKVIRKEEYYGPPK